MRYLITVDSVPHNIILADEKTIADHCASIFGGTARLLGDNEIIEFPQPEIKRETTISKSAWLKRWTQAERIGIRTLAKTNPYVEDFLELLNNAPDVVHLDDPDMMLGVPQVLAALSSAGVIAAKDVSKREAEISA